MIHIRLWSQEKNKDFSSRFLDLARLFRQTADEDHSFLQNCRRQILPLFVLSNPLPHRNQDALRNQDLVDVVHRVRGRRHRVISRNWVTVAGRCGANQAMCTGSSPWPDRCGFIRATFISLRTIAAPSPTSHNPTTARMGRKGFNPTKKGTKCLLQPQKPHPVPVTPILFLSCPKSTPHRRTS